MMNYRQRDQMFEFKSTPLISKICFQLLVGIEDGTLLVLFLFYARLLLFKLVVHS